MPLKICKNHTLKLSVMNSTKMAAASVYEVAATVTQLMRICLVIEVW
jgi:hypothetical protein